MPSIAVKLRSVIDNANYNSLRKIAEDLSDRGDIAAIKNAIRYAKSQDDQEAVDILEEYC